MSDVMHDDHNRYHLDLTFQEITRSQPLVASTVTGFATFDEKLIWKFQFAMRQKKKRRMVMREGVLLSDVKLLKSPSLPLKRSSKRDRNFYTMEHHHQHNHYCHGLHSHHQSVHDESKWKVQKTEPESHQCSLQQISSLTRVT